MSSGTPLQFRCTFSSAGSTRGEQGRLTFCSVLSFPSRHVFSPFLAHPPSSPPPPQQHHRAPGAVAAATEAADRPGSDPDSQCRRSCSGQHMAVPGEPCCDGMWLPSVLVRNVEEFPQGRTQPYSIEVSPEGVVTWRVGEFVCWRGEADVFSLFPFSPFGLSFDRERRRSSRFLSSLFLFHPPPTFFFPPRNTQTEVRGDMYTTLDVRAFPFDSQVSFFFFKRESGAKKKRKKVEGRFF